MEEIHQQVPGQVTGEEDTFEAESLRSITSSETFGSLRDSIRNLTGSSDDEQAPRKRVKKRTKRFSDSDSDSGRDKTLNGNITELENNSQLNDSTLLSDDSDGNVSKSIPHKSRIQINENLSDSDDTVGGKAVKNKEQQLRMKHKKNKLRDKFKSLVTSRGKEPSPPNLQDEVNRKSDHDGLSASDEEIASIEKIKQKIKERISFRPSVCDPDTSDEENSQQKPVYKQKKERKMTKLTSPKPQRMSAKQAMENMQKIKSESNRMLREKEVSLPYHRPKALSLKDIMSRRKQAVSSDGKALPIKMNEDQLKQYAQMLEERQREMIELCKSESEEEEIDEQPTEIETESAANKAETSHDETVPTENTTYINTTNPENHINDNTVNQNSFTEDVEENLSLDKDSDELLKEQDSETSMRLVYNDSANSIVDDKMTNDGEEATTSIVEIDKNIPKTAEQERLPNKMADESESPEKYGDSFKTNTEANSQLMSLHFGTENTNNTIGKDEESKNDTKVSVASENNLEHSPKQDKEKSGQSDSVEVDTEFSDDDVNMVDIDNLIANAEIIKDIEDKVNSQFLVRDKPLNLNPRLTGAPGMIIDLDSSNPEPRKSGIELLKERFTYFSKLKTPEEMEREREKRLKPGTQLKKLKLELEEKIAEQRSLEWAKRLEDEKQHQQELKVLRGEESDEDDIDKIEAAIEGQEEENEGSEKSENEEVEEPIEDDIEIKDKPRIKNVMVDDEAEESECDENEDKGGNENDLEQNDEDDNGIESDNDGDVDDNELESDESDESSESEDEQPSTKKGRILKAFEDSDEEDATKSNYPVVEIKDAKGTSESKSGSSLIENFVVGSQIGSQDEELQLAQRPKSLSDDLFTSQESALLASDPRKSKDIVESDEALTQTFSILDSSKQPNAELNVSSSISAGCSTESLEVNNFHGVAVMCPVTDSQSILPSQIPTTQLSQSQPIGEDVLALCTGQFYDNQFVSQVKENQTPLGESQKYDAFDNYPSQESQEEANDSLEVSSLNDIGKEQDSVTDTAKETNEFIELNSISGNKENRKDKAVDDNLKSILDELDDPEFNTPKPNRFFVGNKNTQKDTVQNDNQVRKKFTIESDDETDVAEGIENKKRKKLKKRKPEKRALQISDDEEEPSEQEEIEEYESDIEKDNSERLVEYDSEENEIEIKPQKPKKKRKMADFFENEAELTSEDEWVGSGDEDEAGLDRMEREEGDDEIFHQGKLQRELGQIHMRDVLDQDKREVRMIQELLFEDGDLGEGGRQRKFRWNNLDGDEETGTVPDDLDTQEEEFESEEQWRKQRHEREIFLREMQNKDDPAESLNVSVNRSTIIKANLQSKTMSSLLMEVNNSNVEKTESPTLEKKISKDVPSPKKPFGLLQHSFQGSLLSRGSGALARLAALATPLAADDDAKVGTLASSNRRNFVFASITPDEKKPKVTKRKAEVNPSTPKLVKKMRTEDNQNTSKSLLDHFKL